MADRTVVIRLLAKVDDYKAAMRAASAATDDVGKATERTAKKSQSTLSGIGGDAVLLAKHARDNEKAWTDVGGAFMGVGLAAGAGLAAASVKFASFDRQMSAVQAATLATSSEMEGLRDVAVKAGADTAFSANEAAQGIEELAKAGIATKDIIGGGLTGALDLAAAGGLDVGRAAEIAATAVTQFGLSGEDVVGVADALAAGANKAQGSVEDLGLALSYAGVPANALGLSVEETTGVLGLFANAGIVGEKAGTALRGMLVSLQNPSEKAAGLMEELGVEVFDAQGNFIGMEATAAVLQDRLGGLDQKTRGAALATIFGNEALGAATTLYNGGAAEVAKWTDAVSESGYAAEVAATRLDNLYGDVEALGGSLETALIGLGESSDGPLRELTQDLTTVVNVFSELPEGAQNAAVGVGLATAAVGLLGGAALIGTPKVVAFYGAVQQLGPAGQKAAAGMRSVAGAAGPIGLVLTAASIAGGLLFDSWIDQKQAVDDYRSSLDETTAALTENTRKVAAKSLQDEGVLVTARKIGIAESVVVDAVLGSADAQAKLADAIDETRKRADVYQDENGLMVANTESQESARALLGDLNVLERQIGVQGNTLDDAVTAQEELARATRETSGASVEARAALFGLNGEIGAAAVLAPQVAEGIDPMAEAIAATGEQSDEATEAIQKWRDELAGIAAGFSEPLSTYAGLLQEKKDAEAESAQATADATEDATDSWKDYADDVSVSLDEYSARLEEQNADQQAWADNLVIIAGRGREGVAAQLAAMGPEGAALVAQMASATDEEFNRAADAMIEDMRFGGDESIAVLDEKMKVLEAIGRAGAGATVKGISEELGYGTDKVREIAATYGIRLAEGINPLLSALGKEGVRPFTPGGGGATEWRPFADGGVENHVAQIASGGVTRVWAEPETMGEAYIPLAPTKRARSLDIWRETGKRLGVESVEAYAFGGISDIPKPLSTSPYRMPVSTAGDAAMGSLYDAAKAWMGANAFGGAPGSGDLVSIGKWLIGKGARVSGHPAFGGATPGAHSKTSLHYRGRAIDVNYGPGGANAQENAFVRSVLPGLRAMANFSQVYYREIGGRTDHDDHLHLGLAKGGILNPHVRDSGGPLLPGFTYNGTGAPETVLPGNYGVGTLTPAGRTTTVTIPVSLTADAPLAEHYARQVADQTVSRLQDAIAANDLGGLVSGVTG